MCSTVCGCVVRAEGVDVVCEQCQLAMRKVAEASYHYSDHEGVAAVLAVKRNVTGICKPPFCHLSFYSLCKNETDTKSWHSLVVNTLCPINVVVGPSQYLVNHLSQ